MVKLSQWGGVAMLASVIGGCTVGPDFKPPKPTTLPVAWAAPSTAPSTQQSVATTQPPIDVAQWWTVLEDPQLNSLIGRAVNANLDLRQATARVRQARATRGIIGSTLWPSVDTSAGYKRTGTRDVSHDLYQAGLDASWELDIFGGNRRSVEAADADTQAAIESRRDTLVTLTAEVALTYIQLRGAQRDIDISLQNLDTQKRTADLTRRRSVAGFVGALDTANADASVASTASQIPPLEAEVRRSIYALSILLGQEPAALLNELSDSAPIPSVPNHVPIGLPSELLRRRPDIRGAEARLHAATASIGVAESDLFPKFNLAGSLGVSANQPKGLANWNNSFWSIGPSVSWPLFDAGRIRSNIELQNAAADEALISYQQVVLNAFGDVENALVDFVKEQEHRDALVISVTANRKALEVSTILYTAGNADFLNVLNAQRSLLASENALVQSDQTIATNLVSLYKALGGGWEDEGGSASTVVPTTQPTR